MDFPRNQNSSMSSNSNNNVFLSYACINTVLSSKKIRCNRRCTKKTLKEKGLFHISRLAQQNLRDLLTILEWNLDNKIMHFRVPEDVFCWFSEYEYENLPEFDIVFSLLEKVGSFCKENQMTLGSHPSQYHVLGSDNENTVEKTIHSLNQQAKMFVMMGLNRPKDLRNINIHLGTTKLGKEKSAIRFLKAWERLADHTKERLTLEEDDKSSMYTIKDLYEMIHVHTGLSLVADCHHYICNDNNKIPIHESFNLASSTWPKDIDPIAHMSSSKTLEDSNYKGNMRAHSDYILEAIPVSPTRKTRFELEAKMKEQSVLRYREQF